MRAIQIYAAWYVQCALILMLRDCVELISIITDFKGNVQSYNRQLDMVLEMPRLNCQHKHVNRQTVICHVFPCMPHWSSPATTIFTHIITQSVAVHKYVNGTFGAYFFTAE